METNKVIVSRREGSIQIEGSDRFLSETLAQLKLDRSATDVSSTLVGAGLDHAWNWFSLHATQRLQGVYFFLLASAFVSGAYVSALRFDLPGVAAGLGVLSLLFSLGFYMLESRVRELLKAGEEALKSAQRRLAESTEVPAFRISDNVEKPKYPLTAYSKVFRLLFISAILGSTLAIAYALLWLRAVSQNKLALVVFYRCVLVVGGVIVLSLSAKLASFNQQPTNWVRYLVIIGLLGTGLLVLVVSAVRPLA